MKKGFRCIAHAVSESSPNIYVVQKFTFSVDDIFFSGKPLQLGRRAVAATTKKIPVTRGLQHQFVKRCATLKKSWFFSVNFFISISILWTEWGLNVLRKRTFFEYLGTPQIQIGCPAFRHQINKRLKVRFFRIISFRTSLNT